MGYSPWGISRQEYWTGLPCPPPGDLPNPGVKPRSPALQEDSLPAEPPGKPPPHPQLRVVMVFAPSLFSPDTHLTGSAVSTQEGHWKEEPQGAETSSGMRGVELLFLLK